MGRSHDPPLRFPAMSDGGRWRETIEDLVRQFACVTIVDGVLCYTTGGLSALEGAFAVLGWSDPWPITATAPPPPPDRATAQSPPPRTVRVARLRTPERGSGGNVTLISHVSLLRSLSWRMPPSS